jgi:Domain of unknown function (DUF4389)
MQSVLGIMTIHPVQFRVEPLATRERIHVAVRLVVLMALGAAGWSSVYWVLFLALPLLVAIRLSQKGGSAYLAEAGPGTIRVLRWFASAYAYLWLLTDVPPSSEAGGPVELKVDSGGLPTAGTAVLRIVTTLPAMVLWILLSVVAGFFWVVGAVIVLWTRRLPVALADFLAMTLRFQFRLVAYHLSLVAQYPSLEETSQAESQLPHGGAA